MRKNTQYQILGEPIGKSYYLLITILSIAACMAEDPSADTSFSEVSTVAVQTGDSDLDNNLSTAEDRRHALAGSANDDIELVDKDIQWHTTADNPTVSYTAEYRNTGTRRIEAKITVACGTVLRNASGSSRDQSWRQFSEKTHSLVLRAGESAKIHGVLEWTASEQRMPWLHFPDPAEHKYSPLATCNYVE